jgi:hypothetical protein
MLTYLNCHTLQPPRLVVLVDGGGLRILAEGVGRRGGGSRLRRNEEVKEAYAPRFGEGVVILSEWGGGEGE